MKLLVIAVLFISLARFFTVSPDIKSYAVVCGKTYRNINNGMLFQDRIKLRLNCDSTYTYSHRCCTGYDTSFGKWSWKDGVVYLNTSGKIKNQQRQMKTIGLFSMQRNFTGSTITFNDSLAVWTIREQFYDIQKPVREDTLKLY